MFAKFLVVAFLLDDASVLFPAFEPLTVSLEAPNKVSPRMFIVVCVLYTLTLKQCCLRVDS